MEHVRFKPWVGKDYCTKGFNGKKILALGEKHHCKPEEAVPEITCNVIKGLLNIDNEREGYDSTFTNFEKAMTGKELSFEERVEFWHSLIFYNYVQTHVSAPRDKPTAQQFEESRPAFFEILEEYKPDLIIVWWKRLWGKLPDCRESGESVLDDDEPLYYYTINDKKIPAYRICKPPPGDGWDYWTKYLQEAIRLAL
jgi:hypothetical protein